MDQVENLPLPIEKIAAGFADPSGLIESMPKVWNSDAVQRRIKGGTSPETRFLFDKANAKPSSFDGLAHASMLPVLYSDSAFTSISSAIVFKTNYDEAIGEGMTMTQETMHAVVSAFIAWLESKPLVNALLLLMLLDIFSGICVAVAQSNLSSTISWKGMMKKVMTLLVLGMAMVIEPFAGGLPVPLANCVALCFICTEGISILENAALMGIPLPAGLVAVVEKMREPANPHISPGSAEVKVEVKTTSTEPQPNAKASTSKIEK